MRYMPTNTATKLMRLMFFWKREMRRSTCLVLPSGVRVEISPGAGVPRRIAVKGSEGSALLTLESYGPWPEGEGTKG